MMKLSALPSNPLVDAARILLAAYYINPTVIDKLLHPYLKYPEAIANHTPSVDDHTAMEQLAAGERTAALVTTYAYDELVQNGWTAQQVPWYAKPNMRRRYPTGVYYVSTPDNIDVVDVMVMAHGDSIKEDLVCGIAFGYRISDIMKYITTNDITHGKNSRL